MFADSMMGPGMCDHACNCVSKCMHVVLICPRKSIFSRIKVAVMMLRVPGTASCCKTGTLLQV